MSKKKNISNRDKAAKKVKLHRNKASQEQTKRTLLNLFKLEKNRLLVV